MSVKTLTKFVAGLAFISITVLTLSGIQQYRAQADDTIDLEIDVAASTPWNVAGIVPGDSGTKTIELHNAGTLDGFVYIWMSDIINSQGGLGNYLFFGVISSNLTTNVPMPATIGKLPYTVPPNNPYFLKMPLDAGATITVDWQWSFPDNGMPQNDAQGDTLSFNINYYLTEPLLKDFTPNPKPSGSSGGGSVLMPFKIDVLGVTTETKMDTFDKLVQTVVAAGPDGKNTLELKGGTKITSANGFHPYEIELQVEPNPPSPPEGMQIIGDAYELVGYTADLRLSAMTFDPLATLSLAYESPWLSGGAGKPCIAFCDETTPWQVIEDSSVVSDNQTFISASISRTGTFAILTEKKSQGQSIVTTTTSTTSVTSTTTTTPTGTTTTVSTPSVTPTQERPVIPSATTSSPTSTTTPVSTIVKQAGPGLDEDGLKPVWRQISLGIALAGVTAMSVLALVERRRRLRRLAIYASRNRISKPR
jgi:hypothetical protein